jgi:hypothetical protein
MTSRRWCASRAALSALALAIPGCTGDGAPDLAEDTQPLIGPPGAAPEVTFPREYTDVLVGRGIRTVTSSRMPGTCITIPPGVKYQVTNRAWRSEGAAVANQAELAEKFGLDANLSVAHGPVSANLGMQLIRESGWSSASMKLVIKAVYTYDVVMVEPDNVELVQSFYDKIKPPAGVDTPAARTARARDFLKSCGRYWTKGVKKGAELAIVYTFHNTTREQRESLTTTAGATVTATTTVGGSVTATQQQAFKTAIQGATLKVYARGFKIDTGDPLTPIERAMKPDGNDQLTSLVGFFTDMKTSINENIEADSLETAQPLTSNTDATKIALIGQYYQPLFRDPRAKGSPLAGWAGNAQADLLTQDNALYSTIALYTNFLRDARAADHTAQWALGRAAVGMVNFPGGAKHTIADLESAIQDLRKTIHIEENPTGPLAPVPGTATDTKAQHTAYMARHCWDLVELGGEPDECYAVGGFYAPAVAALTAFGAGMPKPLNFFSVIWYYNAFTKQWTSGPHKANGQWRWADQVCREHKDWQIKAALGLKLPTGDELGAFAAFLSSTPMHLEKPGMELAERFLWESDKFIGWEWTAPGWTRWDYSGTWAANPNKPFACIRPGGPYALPPIMFDGNSQ